MNESTGKSEILCSVCFPTRYRTEGVKNCIASVLSTATDPTRIEFVIRIDSDDTAMIAAMPVIVDMVHACRSHIKVLAGPRLKDEFKEMFVKLFSECCAAATGKWIWQMEDDAFVMPQSRAWDDDLSLYDPEATTLIVPCANIYNWNHIEWEHPTQSHHAGHFPIMPNKWWVRYNMTRIEPPCDTFTLNFLTGRGFGGDGKGKGWLLSLMPGLITFHIQKPDATFTEKGRTSWA